MMGRLHRLTAGRLCLALTALCVSLAATLAGAPAPDAGARRTGGAAGKAATMSASHRYKADYRRPRVTPYPPDNIRTPAREELGRALFFDPRLSGSGWISCATCHNPGLSWSDGLPRAIGHGMKELSRRTPTILNVAWSAALFWDGRAETLEEQALGPIAAEGEMNLPLDAAVARLRAIAGYQQMFAKAYPAEGISPVTIGKAIATFERGVVSASASFDRWIDGEGTISASAERGFVLFNERARCSVCHTGWRFTDDSFHDLGIVHDDLGRARVTPRIALAHYAFKTPTLRNVAVRRPYLHDGSAPTLKAVIELYSRGGDVRRASLSPEMRRLDLTPEEQQDLEAFLETLTSRDAAIRVPVLPQ